MLYSADDQKVQWVRILQQKPYQSNREKLEEDGERGRWMEIHKHNERQKVEEDRLPQKIISYQQAEIFLQSHFFCSHPFYKPRSTRSLISTNEV
jgi:hypothetical protein